ncbi:serine hydroxymethyltransferase [Candidatus Saccharibacteria bacterium]|nr:serine hydroxymethyltransferase [Candidatus Saccharibacteria bacterium]
MQDLVFDLIDSEKKRQSEGLELIPSENYVSAGVLTAMGSVLTNKYSEGYPSFDGIGCGRGDDSDFKEWDEAQIAEQILPNYRYYGGQANVDRIERLAIDRACRLFHADHANVQPHSGANANEAVYFAWCEPGDKILAMSLPAGGHLTHGAPVTRSAKIYKFLGYGVTEDGDIDYDELERIALAEKPRIILVGYSAFMKIPDFARVASVAAQIPGCLLMADMAHVAGLIAGGVHPNPLDYGFHVMTTTTHKTLRGPRGGLILSRGNVASPLKKPEKTLENIPILIDRAVFPGTQGGPLEHIIAAKAVAFGEALEPGFKKYAANIVKNAKALAEELLGLGFVLQGGGTENHLILVNVQESFGVDGKLYEKALDMVGLTLNANALPTDKGGAFRPSGVRLGTPAITTRGLGVKEMRQLAGWMKKVADICAEAGSEEKLNDYAAELETIHTEVRALSLKFPVPGV